jgi:hypothetical protein
MALALSIGLFVALPNLALELFPKNATGGTLLLRNLTGGMIRILILIGYIAAVGQIPDMRKTFQYHGSEHKTVYCHEHDLPLTPKNAQQFTTLHPRCGTSFLILTLILSILFYTFVDWLLLQLFQVDLSANYFSAMRSLIVAIYELGVEEIMVVAHSHCGACHMSYDHFHHEMIARGVTDATLDTIRQCGIDLDHWLEGFKDTPTSVRKTVETIRTHPLVPKDIVVRGFIIDSETGKLEEIEG